jgi:hypothetical protein
MSCGCPGQDRPVGLVADLPVLEQGAVLLLRQWHRRRRGAGRSHLCRGGNPQGRLRIEILQQSVAALRDTALAELGPELDVGIGFNAADGD